MINKEYGNDGSMRIKYILITPARNEEKYIEKTILSVISQTLRPMEYIIVSDGSTDNTNSIVERYAKENEFISFIRHNGNNQASFSSKVKAFNAGYERIRHLDFDFIGNLDADVSFEPDYFERLVKIFAENEKLGIGGGKIWDVTKNNILKKHRMGSQGVSGAVMFFRRTCFDEIGGYVPVEIGAEDSCAEIAARAKGWMVQTFPKLTIIHHKPALSLNTNKLSASRCLGFSFYLLGYHPLFIFFDFFYRSIQEPYIIGSIFFGLGYCQGYFLKKKKVLSPELIAFLRREQIRRIKKYILTFKQD